MYRRIRGDRGNCSVWNAHMECWVFLPIDGFIHIDHTSFIIDGKHAHWRL